MDTAKFDSATRQAASKSCTIISPYNQANRLILGFTHVVAATGFAKRCADHPVFPPSEILSMVLSWLGVLLLCTIGMIWMTTGARAQ